MQAIHRSLLCSAVIASVVLVSGCASHQGNKQYAVRQQFVPTTDAVARESSRGGASWTALVPLNDGTGVSRLMAHAGIGDRFPVKEEDGRCLFEVLVVEGNDNHLLLEVRSVETPQRINLVRDKSVRVQIGGSKYDLAYPSVTVGAAKNEKRTTSQAMLLIHRRP
jgi:hypothetical protein